MELGEGKAARAFDNVNGIADYFNRNPEKLIEYIQSSMKAKASILGVHLIQLSKLVGIPLEFDGEEVSYLPPNEFVSPRRFNALDMVIQWGRANFPAQ
jgi:hypothetical protein